MAKIIRSIGGKRPITISITKPRSKQNKVHCNLCIIIGITLFVLHKLYGKSLERDVDIVAAIAAENIPNNVPKIMFEDIEDTANNFLVIPEN